MKGVKARYVREPASRGRAGDCVGEKVALADVLRGLLTLNALGAGPRAWSLVTGAAASLTLKNPPAPVMLDVWRFEQVCIDSSEAPK